LHLLPANLSAWRKKLSRAMSAPCLDKVPIWEVFLRVIRVRR
jgi:hypothetical protein